MATNPYQKGKRPASDRTRTQSPDPNQKGKRPGSDRKRNQSPDPKTPHNSYDEAPSKQQPSLLQTINVPLAWNRPSQITAKSTKSTKSCDERKKSVVVVERNVKTAPANLTSRESNSDASDSSSASVRKDNRRLREMAKRRTLEKKKTTMSSPIQKKAVSRETSETCLNSIKEVFTAAEGSPPDSDQMAEAKTPPKEKSPPSSQLAPPTQTTKSAAAPTIFSQEQMNIMRRFAKQCQQTDLRSLEAAFKSLPTPNTYECLASQESRNRCKNRYSDILCLDSSRVVLRPPIDGNDYVHANKLEYNSLKVPCIIAQGPLSTTSADFWRMIWQEKTSAIFMLCKRNEDGRSKCDEYFNGCGIDQTLLNTNPRPPLYTTWYGPLMITPLSQYVEDDVIITELKVSFGIYKTRFVTHFQCTNWPDFSTPNASSPNMVMKLLGKMVSVKGPENSIVVHCSAGIGRSGTLVAIFMLMSDFSTEKAFDVTEAIRNLRSVRCQSVQTFDQFLFIHKFILQFGTSFDILKKEDVSSFFRLIEEACRTRKK